MDDSSFRTSLALVLDEVRNIKDLCKSARTKQLQFALDVCLVAHAVRTGYLVDAVFPPNPEQVFVTLLKALRGKSAAFNHVVWWNHTLTSQSFLVHIPLLQEKLAAVLAGTEDCLFVKLDKPLSATRLPPNRLQTLFHDMRSLMSESHDALALSLPGALTGEILIPLAAVMIDYPVAYFPASSAQASFLEGETLDIYTVSFQGAATFSNSVSDLGKERALLKFSCPQILVGNWAELSPGALTNKLRVKFATRLERIGMLILVTHHTETLDRVAL